MQDSLSLIALLRRQGWGKVARQENARADDAWLTEGLARAQLHEIHSAQIEDGASATGMAVALALAAGATPILWLRTDAAQRQGGRLYATGLMELGLAADALIVGVVADEAALLRAAADGARHPGLGTLVVEAWGHCPGIDLTATRRLMLAAEASGVTVLLLRIGAVPVPSAAATRWSIAACPSTALPADAPGRPAFIIELQRRRGGPSGQRWRVEWDRDTQSFDAETLSGAGLSLAADRAVALDPPASVRRAG